MAEDSKSLITKIHGRYYDVGGFDHPGGCPALECARDRDATELFESYHALHRTLPVATLQQFEIPPEQAESEGRFLTEKRFGPAPFDWERTLSSPFRADLIACAQRYFEEERRRRGLPSIRAATKAPLRRWLEIVGLGLLFFASLVPFVQGDWLTLILVPVLGWVFVINFWHDALHFAMSRNPHVNALIPYAFPWLHSPKMWLHQHTIGHHAFTNDPHRDPDINVMHGLLRQSLGHKWCPFHARQKRPIRLIAFYSLSTLTRNLVRDHFTHASRWFNGTVPLVIGRPWRRYMHVLGRVLVAGSLVVWPFLVFSFWKALAFAIIPSLVLGELFGLFTQVNHVNEENVAAGQNPSSDWYEAQVRTSCTYGQASYLAFIASGGSNLQIEHHLLPGVNHYHLFRLAPEIQRLCEKHGLPYHSYPTFGAALRAHFRCMRRLAEKPGPVGLSPETHH